MIDHYRPVDISSIQVEGNVLPDCVVWFANSGSISKLDREQLVASLGGKASHQQSDQRCREIASPLHCLEAVCRVEKLKIACDGACCSKIVGFCFESSL